MFADALLDSQHAERSRRGWATLTSFGLQAIGVTILLVVPLLFNQGLPQIASVARVLVPVGPAPQVRPQETHTISGGTGAAATTAGQILRVPREVPRTISNNQGVEAPNFPFTTGLSGPTANPFFGDSVIGGAGPGPAPVIPKPPQPRVIKISVLSQGSLIYRVEPIYPPLAKQARIQGAVVLAALIGRDGIIENLQVISGHPMLMAAAKDAVKQWRYRPYVLNGEPVVVETTITVNFVLSR
jgi:periplasmic protein TonB